MADSNPTKTTPALSPCRIPIAQPRNDKHPPVRRSSIAQGADFDDGQILRPWFEDPVKLIAAAFKRALESPDVARQFVTAVATFTEQSPDGSHRTRLLKALRNGKSVNPKRKRKRCIYQSMVIAYRYHVLLQDGMKPCAAYDFLAERHGLSTATLRRHVTASEEYHAGLQNANISAKD